MKSSKKNILLVLMSCIFLLGLVVGCSSESEDPSQHESDQGTNHAEDQNQTDTNDEAAGIVKASIMFYEPPTVGKKAKVDARVTQNQEPVEDAQEVLFEIEKANQDASQENDQQDMTQLPSETAAVGEASIEQDKTYIKAENVGNGVYRINATFTEEGDYYIIAHVTARDMHVMPKYEFNVKSP